MTWFRQIRELVQPFSYITIVLFAGGTHLCLPLLLAQNPQSHLQATEGRNLQHLGVNRAAFSSSGEFCATSGIETLRLWSMKDGIVRAEVIGHPVPVNLGWAKRNQVTAMQFTKDDKLLVTAGADGNIAIWRVPDLVLLKVLSEPLVKHSGKKREWAAWSRLPVSQMAVSSDAKTIARAMAGNVKVWDLDSGAGICEFGEHFAFEQIAVDDLVPSEYRFEASEWKKRFAREWLSLSAADLPPPFLSLPRESKSHYAIGSLGFSANGRLLAFSDQDTHVLDWRSGKLLHRFPRAGYSCFSPDGMAIATCDQYGPIIVRDSVSGIEKLLINVRASGIVFSADGESLFACKGSQICRFSVRSGEELDVYDAATSGAVASAIIIEPNGSLLGGIWKPHSMRVLLWDITRDKNRD